jgi:hypothetical protein
MILHPLSRIIHAHRFMQNKTAVHTLLTQDLDNNNTKLGNINNNSSACQTSFRLDSFNIIMLYIFFPTQSFPVKKRKKLVCVKGTSSSCLRFVVVWLLQQLQTVFDGFLNRHAIEPSSGMS